jgi:hypothetical protein
MQEHRGSARLAGPADARHPNPVSLVITDTPAAPGASRQRRGHRDQAMPPGHYDLVAHTDMVDIGHCQRAVSNSEVS